MSPGRSRLVFAAAATVVAFQLACPLAIASRGDSLSQGQYATKSDAAAFRGIFEHDGTPYRDFEVAYPPVALGVFRALGPGDFGGFRQRLLALQVACQALIVLLLFRVWGRRAGWSYLVLSAPMLFVVYTGFDLVAVAIAVSAAALVRRRHPEAGAIGFVLGAFTKIWPAALVPGLVVARRGRALAVAVIAGAAGLAAWFAWGGTGALGQVLTFKGAHGWEYESLPGSLLRLFTGDPLRIEQGSWRVGSPPNGFGTILTLFLVAAIVAVWWLASQRQHHLPEGLAETAAVVALLVFGTLLSPQFLIWPLPFVAIAAANGARRIEAWAGTASALTLLGWIWFDPYRPALGRSEIAILGRNVALVGLLVVAVMEIRKVRADGALIPGG
jgi:hypothetical protein